MKKLFDKLLSDLYSKLKVLKPDSIATIYLGGGTPSLVDEELLSSFFKSIYNICFKLKINCNPKEISIESNPTSLSKRWLTQMSLIGVSRVSVGVQSFHPKLRKTIGRTVEEPLNHAKLINLTKIIKKLSMQLGIDIITGLPNQTKEQAIDDLKEGLNLKPDHISLYRLSIESDTKLDLKVKRGELLIDDDNGDIVELGAIDYLKKSGFNQYEVSNFSKKGCESKHNRVYWNMDNYLGLGPSAVSTLHNYDCQTDEKVVYRIKNCSDINSYLNDEKQEIEKVSYDDFLFENLMMGLRLKDGIDIAKFKNRFGLTPYEKYSTLCDTAIDRGDLISSKNQFKMSEKGMMFLNKFLVELM